MSPPWFTSATMRSASSRWYSADCARSPSPRAARRSSVASASTISLAVRVRAPPRRCRRRPTSFAPSPAGRPPPRCASCSARSRHGSASSQRRAATARRRGPRSARRRAPAGRAACRRSARRIVVEKRRRRLPALSPSVRSVDDRRRVGEQPLHQRVGRGVVVIICRGRCPGAARTAACRRPPRRSSIGRARRTRRPRTAARAGSPGPPRRTHAPPRRSAKPAAGARASKRGRLRAPSRISARMPDGALDHHLAHVGQRLADQRDAAERLAVGKAAAARAPARSPIRRRRASCRRRARPASAACAAAGRRRAIAGSGH